MSISSYFTELPEQTYMKNSTASYNFARYNK